MNITETEFSTDLNPVRATVAVSLTVIEGKSVPYLYSKAMVEAMSPAQPGRHRERRQRGRAGMTAPFGRGSRYRDVPESRRRARTAAPRRCAPCPR